MNFMNKTFYLFTIVLLMFAIAAAAAAAAPNKFVEIEIGGLVSEKHALYNFIYPSSFTIKQYLDILDKARFDPAVGGLILKISRLDIGWAKMQQLRRAIHAFRSEGKPTFALIDGSFMPSYLIACACDKVYLQPASVLMMTGLRLEVYYWKDLLDKIGIKVDCIPIGRFKNFAEPFISATMSDAAREMFTSLLDDAESQFISIIVEERGLTTDTVRRLIDEGPFTAREAAIRGLADGFLYEDELHAQIESGMTRYLLVDKEYGREKPAMPDFNFFTLLFPQSNKTAIKSGKPKIAYILATGNILPGGRRDYPFRENIIASEDICADIRECAEEQTIGAIIIRIESPGGSMAAADQIWRALRKASKKKPVIASLSDVAASGGYYIAMAANRIIAEPGTLTGSIGVISMKVVLQKLMEKTGVKAEVISRGKMSGIFSPLSHFSEEERAAMQRISLAHYDEFTSKVAAMRGVGSERMASVAEGRVWTGRQALENGLVDKLGGIDEAVSEAKRLAGIPSQSQVELEMFPRQMGFLEFIQELMTGGTFGNYNPSPMGMSAFLPLTPFLFSQIQSLIYLAHKERSLAILPFIINIQ